MDEELYSGFERYLTNEMPQNDKIIFEQKLQKDAQLRESFERYKETSQFLNHKYATETADFKEQLTSISEKYFDKKTKPQSQTISLKPYYYAIAASVAIAFGAWFMMQQNPQYSDYNQHERAIFVERSLADENSKNAQDFFNDKKYDKAVEAFEKIEDFTSTELQYFYAISLIETNNFIKADLLLTIIKRGQSVYKDKATWNLALSQLKQKNYDLCKKYLKQIPVDAEDYEKAQKLLHDLD